MTPTHYCASCDDRAPFLTNEPHAYERCPACLTKYPEFILLTENDGKVLRAKRSSEFIKKNKMYTESV